MSEENEEDSVERKRAASAASLAMRSCIKVKTFTCKSCGKVFQAKGRAKYCCKTCAQRERRKRKRNEAKLLITKQGTA